MVTNIQESDFLEEDLWVEETNTGINSDNSYEELKKQVEELKNNYSVDPKIIFNYFLWINNGNHDLVKKHGEIMALIKSNKDLDREEFAKSLKSISPKVLSVKDLFKPFTDIIWSKETKKTD